MDALTSLTGLTTSGVVGYITTVVVTVGLRLSSGRSLGLLGFAVLVNWMANR